MRTLCSLIIFTLFLQVAIAQTTEETCSPGFNRDGHCNFYEDVILSDAVGQRATTLFISHWKREAYKDYSNLPYTRVRFTLAGGGGGSAMFEHVAFELLDENDVTFQTIPATVPPSDGTIEQDIFLLGASKLKIAYSGPFYTNDAGITKIVEITDPFSCDVLHCNNGKVGIGTVFTGPHKLAVEGSIGARRVKVQTDGWSDFVFNNDYKLKTLDEVEDYVAENSHLPGIPSEAEVIKNGIYLGEMDAKLLQKIEELTLYLIEQNKQIQALKKEVSVLKNK